MDDSVGHEGDDQAKTRSVGINPGLPPEWQRPLDLNHCLVPSWVCNRRNMESSVELGLEPRQYNTGHGHCEQHLNHCTEFLPCEPLVYLRTDIHRYWYSLMCHKLAGRMGIFQARIGSYFYPKCSNFTCLIIFKFPVCLWSTISGTMK